MRFASVYGRKAQADTTSWMHPHPKGVTKEFKTEDISELTNKLKINKPSEPGGTHPRFLKELKGKIAYLRTKICNLYLKMSSVSEAWKIANVTPSF